ncbi:MAG TPA: serine hydrolase domain-containing protein [Candidatus Limnocylindrales bacterium]|nr:serine hydrolase domain-containing protein [Candidatus Limnocylindrales bacterium]
MTIEGEPLAFVGPEIEALLDRQMSRWQVPGAALGIVLDDQELVRCAGVTNVDHPLLVTDRTLFQIGSTTKTMTATLVMQHVAAGELDLDAPLRRYLDIRLGRDDWAAALTVRHLLTHMSGWDGDHFLMHPVGARGDDALARLVEALPTMGLHAPPGALFAYSNANFAVLGRLLEVLRGDAYDRLLRQDLLVPLGMGHTLLLPDDVVTDRVAVGHHMRDGRPTVARPWALERAAAAHGGVVTDVRDDLAYLRFHLGDGRTATGDRLLPKALLEEMERPQVGARSTCLSMGLSWQLDEVDGVRTVSHGGETNGQLSEIVLVPARRFGFVVLTNADGGAALSRSLRRHLFRRLLGLSTDPPPTSRIAPSRQREFAGDYLGTMRDVVVRRERGTLQAVVRTHARPGRQPPDDAAPVELRELDEDRVVTGEEPELDRRGEFIRDEAGVIRWLHWDGRLLRRADSTSPCG